VDESLVAGLKPDFIYLTHIHWDHFHGPSLRRFARHTPILVPKGHTDKIKTDLERMGFTQVIELRHGQRFSLGPTFALTSYQFFPYLDSAVVLDVEGVTLLNANDAKFMGGPLRQILKNHPKIDFVFRSHSSANGRVCYEVMDDPGAEVDTETRYIESFAVFAKRTGARYAIPFASNHCHLHKDVWPFNSYIQTPVRVEDYFRAQGWDRPHVQVMVSGDSWSSETGFHIRPESQRFFEKRDECLQEYREAQKEKLEEFYRMEETARISLDEVRRLLSPFFRALPFYFRGLYRRHPLTFVLTAGERRFVYRVDFCRRSVEELRSPDSADEIFQMHTSVHIFKKSLAVGLFAMIPISKRVRYCVTRRNKKYMEFLNTLFCLFEYRVPPLARPSLRFFETWALRWREVFLYSRILFNLARGKKFNECRYIENA
jgi:UDP-MurNAc hydroxylase